MAQSAQEQGRPLAQGPPVEAPEQLRTDCELEEWERAHTPPPRPGLAGFALLRYEYETALADTERIEEWVAERVAQAEGEGARGALYALEAHHRHYRAHALAGLGRRDEAIAELEAAHGCLRLADSWAQTHGGGVPTGPVYWQLASVWERVDEPGRELRSLDLAVEKVAAEGPFRDQVMAESGPPTGDERHDGGPTERPAGGAGSACVDVVEIQFWAATLEVAVRQGADPTEEHKAAATRILTQGKCPGLLLHHRARALASEVMGDRRRALDQWQRYCIACLATGEPEDGSMVRRGWDHVERLGGGRWA